MRILFVNQSYSPDCTATAQYLTDLTAAFVEKGHEVHVLCSDRDYLNHTKKHRSFEKISGVHVHRVRSIVFPRSSRFLRYLNAILMNLSFTLRLLFFRKVDRLVVMTTPPLIDWLCVFLKGSFVPVILWAMDVNPDQAIKTGWFRREGRVAQALLRLQAYFLQRCAHIIVLDRYMKELMESKGVPEHKITAIPLWSDLDEAPLPEHQESFRDRHDLSGKFLVMYAGNHSVCHPLGTLLEAAKRLLKDETVAFVFVGGGARYAEVQRVAKESELSNVYALPYQPREHLAQMLNTADVHVISMGEEYVGIVHPSKVYHLLATGRPIVLLGPQASSVGDVLAEYPFSEQVNHGDVEGLVHAIQTFRKNVTSNREKQVSVSEEIGERYCLANIARRIEQIIEANSSAH